MLLKLFWSAISLPLIFGFDENVVKLSLDYFVYRNVKFACLITCETNNYWSFKFVKYATKLSIPVSKVDIGNDDKTFTGIEKCLEQKYFSLGVLIESKCLRFDYVMTFASMNRKFDSMHKWLIVDDHSEFKNMLHDTGAVFNDTNDNYSDSNYDSNAMKSVEVLKNLNISVDADIMLCIWNGHSGYNLYESFNFGKVQGGKLTLTKVGYWSSERGFTILSNLNGYKYYRRWDFEQWSMRMMVVMSNTSQQFDPEMITGRKPSPGVAHITQTSAMVLHALAEIHNIRYNYSIGERWIGNYSKEHSRKVAGTALYHGEQDITPVMRILQGSSERYDTVFRSVTSIETRYYYQIPTHGPGKFENQFIRPLSAGAWLCALALISLCAMALMLSAVMERRPMPVQYAVFSVLASFCQQFFDDSAHIETRSKFNARKLVVLVTGLSCVLIYNYYTSSVVSWLLSGPPPSINSLEELLESPLELIYEDIGYTRSWLQTPSYYYNKRNAKVEDEMRMKKVFNKKKNAPLLMPVDDGIEMVKAGGYAYHTEVDTANRLISRKFTQAELCELGSLQSMEKTPLYPGIQRSSPYKEFLVWSLSRLTERGIVSCIQQRTSSSSLSCEGSSPRALAVGGAAPAFILLVLGYLCAIIIMLLERFMHRLFINNVFKIGNQRCAGNKQ